MINIKSFILGLVLGIVGVWLYFQQYPNTETIVKEVVKYKTVVDTKYVKEPKIISVILPKDTFIIPADTAELIRRYKELSTNFYTRNNYKDTLSFDTLGFCVLEQQVYRNRIDSLKFSYSLTIPEKTVYSIANQKKSLYIGGLLGKDILAPTLTYNYKQYGFGVGYNFLNKEVLFSLNYKIK